MFTRVNDLLFRGQRPGYPSEKVDAECVKEWIQQAHKLGIRTIICLLDDNQLAYYDDDEGRGLLGSYGTAGFEVVHYPIPDYQDPPVPERTLGLLYDEFRTCKKPVLVHCSAGIGRTGAVIDCLKRFADTSS